MTKKIQYRPHGTCSRMIEVELDEEGRIINAKFSGGCSGNTQGISALVKGMDAHEAIERLSGIKCGFRDTSCPDQLSVALKKLISE